MNTPRIGGGKRREACHLGHPIEVRVYGGKARRRCWTCYGVQQRRLYRPGTSTHRDRMRAYGLGPEAYDEMLSEQDGLCAICRRPCRTGQGLSVDHDHETGQVRGLLCRTCNLGIGHLGDDPVLVSAALSYLERASAKAGS